MSRSRSGPATMLVGLDGACAGVLDPLFESDETPTLRRLFARGASGPLRSQIPPWTASAWPSIYSGMNPGKHGIHDFLSFDGYGWEVVDATDLRERPIWELLDWHGLSSVVVNAPVTHPPEPFDGALVPGYMAPERPHCHPEGLLEDIEDAIGTYRVYPADHDDPEEDLRERVAVAHSRGRAARYLIDRFDPEFVFLQFQVTDTVIHERPGDRDALAAIYRAVDEELERTIAECNPDTVIAVSDHGVGPYDGHEFRINEYLREEGFVETTRSGRGMPTWSTERDNALKQGQEADDSPGLGARTMSALSRVGITSQRIGATLDALRLGDLARRLAPEGMVRAGTEQVDFAASRAYMRSRTELGVRINLEGREPDGVVPPEEYEATREALIKSLKAARTPDGDPVFEAVAPREHYVHGPAAGETVDVFTVPVGFDQFLSTTVSQDVFGDPSEAWNHKRTGVFAARGAAVDEGADVGEATLFDVAPTVLATLGVPADRYMDGDVLPVAEPVGARRYPETDRGSEQAVDTGDVAERLSDLGYIE